VKTFKIFGLIAPLAVIAMALLGPPAAMGESTSLCEVDEATCNSPVEHVHYTGDIEVLTSAMNYYCEALFLGDVSELGAPQIVEGNFTYTDCNNGCTRTEENGPAVLNFLKIGHETGEATGESLVHVHCGAFINCNYTLENVVGSVKGPLLSSGENGEVSFNEQAIVHESGFICPEEAFLDGTFEPLSAIYISS
jgi:hypothetical protein